MAKLYAKVDSDIRAGLGCRAKDRIRVTLYYNFDGRNDQDGEMVVEAEHTGTEVRMTVVAKIKAGDGMVLQEPISEVSFRPKLLEIVKLTKKGTTVEPVS